MTGTGAIRLLLADVDGTPGDPDDVDAVARATSAAHDRFGDHVLAAWSQPDYLDVTHPEANKARSPAPSARSTVPCREAIATIGDAANDVLMFAHSGLSIAMGNASLEVQRAARRVTASNADEGFASAVERFILPHHLSSRSRNAPSRRPASRNSASAGDVEVVTDVVDASGHPGGVYHRVVLRPGADVAVERHRVPVGVHHHVAVVGDQRIAVQRILDE